MHTMKPTGLDPALDRIGAEPKRDELCTRGHPVLGRGKPGHARVRPRYGAFMADTALKSPSGDVAPSPQSGGAGAAGFAP